MCSEAWNVDELIENIRTNRKKEKKKGICSGKVIREAKSPKSDKSRCLQAFCKIIQKNLRAENEGCFLVQISLGEGTHFV